MCGAGATAEVFRYGPHRGEEPPISGSRGSGTIFFSRCTLKCVYCQNYPWSQEGRGELVPGDSLAGVFRELAGIGCHNWNLVSPTPWLAAVEEALGVVKKEGISLPVVYNTSGFERVEIVEELRGLVDVFLPDLRYSRAESAREGSGVTGYVEAAREALKAMWRAAGPLKTDEKGVAVSGVICRLLILPNRAREAVENLEWLAEAVGTEIAVSVMAQYVPAFRGAALPGWNRRINDEEYGQVCDAVERLGFDNGWIQERDGMPLRELIGYEMKSGAGTAGKSIEKTGRVIHERT